MAKQTMKAGKNDIPHFSVADRGITPCFVYQRAGKNPPMCNLDVHIYTLP